MECILVEKNITQPLPPQKKNWKRFLADFTQIITDFYATYADVCTMSAVSAEFAQIESALYIDLWRTPRHMPNN